MPEPEALAAALLQLSAHTETLAELDAREAKHSAEIGDRVAALTSLASAMKRTLEDQSDILAGVKDLDSRLLEIAARVDDLAPADDADFGYRPARAPRFWQLHGEAREEAIGKLRAWVEQIYQPGYGQIAATLGGCWDQHPFCLYALDWLSELWSVLYLQPRRTTGNLAGQAEWQTRLLTAAAEQMAAETARCEHSVLRSGRPARIGSAQ
jgi:hypothetical protein